MKQILNRAWFEQRIIARIAVVIEDSFRNERKVYFFAVLWRQISSINWHNIHRNLQMADMNFLMPTKWTTSLFKQIICKQNRASYDNNYRHNVKVLQLTVFMTNFISNL